MWRRSPRLWVIAAALAAVPLLWLVEPLERAAFDQRLQLRRSSWPADLVMIPIDDGAIRENGSWPWSRDLVVRLVEKIHESGAKTIVLGVLLPGPSREPEVDARLEARLPDAVIPVGSSRSGDGPPADERLRKALLPTGAPPGNARDPRALLLPWAPFAKAAGGFGHGISPESADLVTRRHLPLIGVDGESGALPSFALAALRHQRGWEASAIRFDGDALVLPHGRLPLRDGEALLDWVPGDEPPRRVRARDLMAGEAPAGALEGAMAVIYLDSTSVGDRTFMPAHGVVPGGIALAVAIRTLDGLHSPRPVPVAWALAFVVAAFLGAAPWLSLRPPRVLVTAGVVAPLVIGAAGAVLVPATDVFLPFAAPSLLSILACIGLAIRSDRLAETERKHLKGLLDAAKALPAVERDSQETIEKRRPSTLGELAAGAPLAVPVSVGRYRVTRCIGRGGMGAIFHADDTELDRSVALKVLTAQDPAAFERFRREALSIARIDHPNVVRIFEIGTDAEVPFIVIEYVDGGSGVEWVRKFRPALPPWRQSSRLIRDVASGLGAAHAAGIVHRDVKPGNILLTSSGVAKIADFGIAKLGGSVTLTQEGSLVGTVGYLSPEQALGVDIDPRSDVYSLGVTWYHLLTGRRPFDGTTAEILRRQSISALPDPRKMVEEIPAPVADLLMRMTAVERTDRPADGREVAAALDEVLATPPSP